DRIPNSDDPKAKAALLQLTGILETLGAEEQMVFVLHCLEGLPLVEVAEAMDTSLSTVKRRMKRANERVLRRVQKHPLLADYVMDKAEVLDKSEVLSKSEALNKAEILDESEVSDD